MRLQRIAPVDESTPKMTPRLLAATMTLRKPKVSRDSESRDSEAEELPGVTAVAYEPVAKRLAKAMM